MKQDHPQAKFIKIFRLAFTVVPLIFVVAGLCVAGYGVFNVLQAKQSENWPAVEGTMLSAGVRSHTTRVQQGRGAHRIETSYIVDVEYEYEVGGRKFQGERISFGDFTGRERQDEAQAVAESYAEGKQVEVYYDPDAPGTAVLEPGISNLSYFPLFVGGGISAAALFMLGVVHLLLKPSGGSAPAASQGGASMASAVEALSSKDPFFPFMRTPREIPLSVRGRIFLGGFWNQFGWFLLGLGMIYCGVCAFVIGEVATKRVYQILTASSAIFPFFGIIVLVISILKSSTSYKLLSRGTAALARLTQKEGTNSQINERRVFRLTYEFEDSNGGPRRCLFQSHTPEIFNEKDEIVLYDPRLANRSVLLKHISGAVRLDEFGTVQNPGIVSLLPYLIGPGLTVVGVIAFFGLWLFSG